MPMQRYFLYFRYDGAAYRGWQVQPGERTVQGELQRALSVLLRGDVPVVGAGRTDTGVHARMMVAHFDAAEGLDCRQTVYRLNRLLPRDIAADRLVPVPAEMHARFSATSRTYHYYIHTRRSRCPVPTCHCQTRRPAKPSINRARVRTVPQDGIFGIIFHMSVFPLY